MTVKFALVFALVSIAAMLLGGFSWIGPDAAMHLF